MSHGYSFSASSGRHPAPTHVGLRPLPSPETKICKLTFIKCSRCAEFEPLLDSTSSTSPAPSFRANPRHPPQKKEVRAVHPTVSGPPSLSLPTRVLRRSDYRLKAFVWTARKASCLAQAQAPKQVAAAGDPALGGGLLRTLHWKARRPHHPNPHLRRAAVAILISDRLNAAGAGHSDIAALKAQVYAHHRHGAGYCSGSGPGPAADTAHGTRRGWRVERARRVG